MNANTDGIPLADEISYIKKYVELQRMRSVNPNFVNLSIRGEIKRHKVPPMIFISLVENAFKYAANKYKDRSIELCFDVSTSGIEFTCRNIFCKNFNNTGKGGVGIKLVMQRLDLLYGNRYTMDTRVNEDEMYYEVKLKVPLGDN